MQAKIAALPERRPERSRVATPATATAIATSTTLGRLASRTGQAGERTKVYNFKYRVLPRFRLGVNLENKVPERARKLNEMSKACVMPRPPKAGSSAREWSSVHLLNNQVIISLISGLA